MVVAAGNYNYGKPMMKWTKQKGELVWGAWNGFTILTDDEQ